MNDKRIVNAAITGVMALGLVAASSAAVADKKAESEKCYGVAKVGKNDCGANGHSCAGQYTKEMKEKGLGKNEWVKLPKGLCDKLESGSTEKPA